METVLIELRRYVVVPKLLITILMPSRYMALPQHKKLPQPAEGSQF